MSQLELSVVVPVWNNLPLTRRFVDSVRSNTDVSYELVIVDNGSAPDAVEYARGAADHVILNTENRGFAPAMNQGLAVARGTYVAFCNNDTVLPPSWASRLVASARDHPRAAIVVPAITTASNPVTVRTEPGDAVEVLDPFSAPPAAVVYVMGRSVITELGAWEEEYEIASGEDVDLCFKVWVNDRDIVYDQRVLVEHVGHATGSKLDDSQQLWIRNRQRFLAKWTGSTDPPRLSTCERERFERNRATARSVARWMEQYFTIRDRKLAQEPDAPRGRTLSPRRLASQSLQRLRRTLGS